MTKCIFFTIVLTSSFLFGQAPKKSTTDVKITYQLKYKRLVDSEDRKISQGVLLIGRDNSFFSFEGMIELNKLKKEKELTIDDVMANQPPYYLVIKREKGNLVHYESIVNDYYLINEPVLVNWDLINQDSLIGKVNCKKAITNYGGRKWIAWYNPEIAVSTGPYVFDGLPGLIYKISDSENTFTFDLEEIKNEKFEVDSNIANYFINSEQKPFEAISREKFFKIRSRLNRMSLDQRMAYMNRRKEEQEKLLITDENGEAIRTNSPAKAKNFFEKDQL